jgi:carbon-monoxide dehydrogenase medium subunit
VSPFELVEPHSLQEALELLEPNDRCVRPAGGFTALMLMMKSGMLKPTRLVSLRRVAPCSAAIEEGVEAIRIGAMTSLAAIERSVLVRRELPGVAQALRTLANVRVRNVATLGGNLAHADPHMDLPPLLIALGAVALVAGRDGQRELPLADLISGYYETTLADGEIILGASIPKRFGSCCAYRKVTARSADDWPTLGIAVALEATDGVVNESRVVLSAAFDRPQQLASVQALLRGARLDECVIARAGEAAAAEVEPIADAHGSAAYKRELVRIHVQRSLRQAWAAQVPGRQT